MKNMSEEQNWTDSDKLDLLECDYRILKTCLKTHQYKLQEQIQWYYEDPDHYTAENLIERLKWHLGDVDTMLEHIEDFERIYGESI